MLRIIDGETDYMGVLYERYRRPMYGYFFRLTNGDAEASMDLVQQVFYKAMKYCKSFKGDGSFAKWIFRIAHNLGIDFIRRRGSTHLVEYDSSIHDPPCNDPDNLEKTESLNILNNAIGLLPPDDRELLLLAKISELKYSEICEITGLTESAVKTRIFRILKKLRENYSSIEKTRYEKERI